MLTPSEMSARLATLQSEKAGKPNPKADNRRINPPKRTKKYLPSLFSPNGIVVLGDRSMNVDTLISWAWASIRKYGSGTLLQRVRKQYGSEADLVQDILLLILTRSAPFAEVSEEWRKNNRGDVPVSAWIHSKRTSTYFSAMQAQSAYRFALGAKLVATRYVNGVRAMEGERFPEGVHIDIRMEMVRGNAPQRMSELYDPPAETESAIGDGELYAEIEKLIGADTLKIVKDGIVQASKVGMSRRTQVTSKPGERSWNRFDLSAIIGRAMGKSKTTGFEVIREARDRCIREGLVKSASAA